MWAHTCVQLSTWNQSIKIKSFYFLKDTAARLSYRKNAEVQEYSIPVTVKDRAGQSATKILRVNLCDCTHPSQCAARSRSAGITLGKWAILAILLGIALLFCKYFHSLEVKMQDKRSDYPKGYWEVNIDTHLPCPLQVASVFYGSWVVLDWSLFEGTWSFLGLVPHSDRIV